MRPDDALSVMTGHDSGYIGGPSRADMEQGYQQDLINTPITLGMGTHPSRQEELSSLLNSPSELEKYVGRLDATTMESYSGALETSEATNSATLGLAPVGESRNLWEFWRDGPQPSEQAQDYDRRHTPRWPLDIDHTT